MKRQSYFWRGFFYVIGLLVLTCGITLNTKTLLGVSPIISIPNCLSALGGWDLGRLVTLLYLLFVAVQIPLKGRCFGLLDVMQLPVSVLSGWLVSFYDANLTVSNPGIPLRLALLALAIVLTGIGVCLTVNMELAPNPADGLVNSISERTNKNMGLCKNIFDVTCVGVTSVLSLALRRQLIGIGLGTVVTMLLTGRVISLVNRRLRKPMRRLAGLEPTAVEPETQKQAELASNDSPPAAREASEQGRRPN